MRGEARLQAFRRFVMRERTDRRAFRLCKVRVRPPWVRMDRSLRAARRSNWAATRSTSPADQPSLAGGRHGGLATGDCREHHTDDGTQSRKAKRSRRRHPARQRALLLARAGNPCRDGGALGVRVASGPRPMSDVMPLKERAAAANALGALPRAARGAGQRTVGLLRSGRCRRPARTIEPILIVLVALHASPRCTTSMSAGTAPLTRMLRAR